MLTLILFRHAKAAPALPGQNDFDRPLTERGRRDAARMGSILANHTIDLALVSGAARTRETFQIATAALEPMPRAEITRDLYLCGTRKLIGRLSLAPWDARTLLVVGHNPDLHEIALWLAGSDNSRQALALRAKFPTASLVVFEIDAESWEKLDPKDARLLQFTIPADFEG